MSKAISNITTNGEHVAINEDGDYIYKLNDRYYVVYTYFNSDLYNYLDDNSIEDAGLQMEGVSVDDLGLDTVVYFPLIVE